MSAAPTVHARGTATPMSGRTVALAAIEAATIAAGIRTADALVKTAPVELFFAEAVSPGKFVVVFGGGVGEVRAAYERGREIAGTALLDGLELPQCHPDVLAAFEGLGRGPAAEALGILEADSIPATLLGADRAAKTAPVKLRRIRLANGLGGRGYVLLDGTLPDVTAAVGAARALIGAHLVDSGIVPRLAEPVRDRLY